MQTTDPAAIKSRILEHIAGEVESQQIKDETYYKDSTQSVYDKDGFGKSGDPENYSKE